MSANQAAIMTWVSSIRTTMANDPGRQLLEDQIQTNGFLFLEDYLESILVKPKHNPIIELVKTPARRRNAPKKLNGGTAAALKAKPIVTMDLEDLDSDKENEIPPVVSTPINAFHKALLQSKDPAPSSKPSMSRKKPDNKNQPGHAADIACEDVLTDEEDQVEEKFAEKLVAPHLRIPPPQRHETGPPKPVASASRAESRTDLFRHEPGTDLSVIAEEPAERSNISMTRHSVEDSAVCGHMPDRSSSKIARSLKPYPRKTPPTIDMATIMGIDDFTQTIDFNTMPLRAQPSQVSPDDRTTSFHETAPASSDRPSRAQSLNSHQSTPHDVAPLPSDEPPTEMLTEDQEMETGVGEKPGISEYSTIGPPSPLRKSIRVPKEPQLAATHALPATKQTTTRSSWLVKAREAKAMEDNTKKLIPRPTLLHHLAAGSKRKSGDMLGTERDGLEHEGVGRTQKLTKIIETSPELKILNEKHPLGRFRDETVDVVDEGVCNNVISADDSDDMIDKLKKTVAGFSARAGRSMGKSLGGAAATALAEARAAAEAKIAERNAAEGRIIPIHTTAAPHDSDAPNPSVLTSMPVSEPVSRQTAEKRTSDEKDRRLSVSDLVSKFDTNKEVERVFQPPPPDHLKPGTATVSNSNATANTSTSTTPPASPPKTRPPIFTLPERPKLPPVSTFFPTSNHAFPRFDSQSFVPPRIPQPLSTHPTLFSTQSTYADAIFDDEMPAWVPSTQDTDFSDHGPSQNALPKPSNRDVTEPETDMDADESWHLDEKFGEIWTPVVIGMKDDSMTWSTAPTRSTRSADTGALDASVPPAVSKPSPAQELCDAKDAAFDSIPSDNPPCSTTDEIDEEDMDVEFDEDIASVRLVTPAPQSKNSRLSNQSSRRQFQEESQASSNNSGGFFSSASKLVSSVLGGSKKGKEPVKSLQLAAAVAKKQQEEAEKKANRLKEMEARRQQVLQKKAEEDKAREEKKAKDEAVRWKREKAKEDTTEKRVLKQPGKKVTQLEEELAKKRKGTEAEKKTETKFRDKKDVPGTKIGKFVPTNSQSGANAPALSSKTIKQTTTAVTQSFVAKVTNAQGDAKSTLGAKAKEGTKEADVTVKQASQLVQSQMQARYQAQLDDRRHMPPPVSTESIELPDINSEYSDSDDENRVRTFDPPVWAQSPELREALQSQSTVNPDDIFGAIRPLKMEELFKNRTSRFRARTSSANWAGTDELTVHEEREYARRMGYRK